jgi:hypothetical protein
VEAGTRSAWLRRITWLLNYILTRCWLGSMLIW